MSNDTEVTVGCNSFIFMFLGYERLGFLMITIVLVLTFKKNIMDNFFLVVYDYPWCVDGTDVWLTKPYKLAASLKDAKKDARFYKRVYPNYDVKVLPVDSTGRFGSPVFKL